MSDISKTQIHQMQKVQWIAETTPDKCAALPNTYEANGYEMETSKMRNMFQPLGRHGIPIQTGLNIH